MRDTKSCLLFSLIALLMVSCGIRIEKRRYQKGFYVQKHRAFSHNKIQTPQNQTLSSKADSLLSDSQTNNENLAREESNITDHQNAEYKVAEEIPEKTAIKKQNTEEKAVLTALFPKVKIPQSLNSFKKLNRKKRQLINAQKHSADGGNVGAVFGIVLLTILTVLFVALLMILLSYGAPTNAVLITIGIIVCLIVLIILTAFNFGN